MNGFEIKNTEDFKKLYENENTRAVAVSLIFENVKRIADNSVPCRGQVQQNKTAIAWLRYLLGGFVFAMLMYILKGA